MPDTTALARTCQGRSRPFTAKLRQPARRALRPCAHYRALHTLVAEQSKGHGVATEDMLLLNSALQTAVKSIAARISRAGIEGLTGLLDDSGRVTAAGDQQKKLDVVSNEIMKAALAECGVVGVIASEEDDEPVILNDTGKLVVVFDPLDGSRNIDASIPTGTIFGVYRRQPSTGTATAEAQALQDCMQPGSELIAAGYALYSSATMLVLTFGQGTHGFTLDPQTGEFVLTHPNIAIPARGQIYSLNDARYFDWPEGLRTYIDTIRQGKGQNPVQYSARYICSLVGDFHRTLLYGGWAANPRPHLRLVYEGNPLAFLCEQAGGSGSDGRQALRSIKPQKLHHKLPVFLGSRDDLAELESYGDVQQGSRQYNV